MPKIWYLKDEIAWHHDFWDQNPWNAEESPGGPRDWDQGEWEAFGERRGWRHHGWWDGWWDGGNMGGGMGGNMGGNMEAAWMAPPQEEEEWLDPWSRIESFHCRHEVPTVSVLVLEV